MLPGHRLRLTFDKPPKKIGRGISFGTDKRVDVLGWERGSGAVVQARVHFHSLLLDGLENALSKISQMRVQTQVKSRGINWLIFWGMPSVGNGRSVRPEGLQTTPTGRRTTFVPYPPVGTVSIPVWVSQYRKPSPPPPSSFLPDWCPYCNPALFQRSRHSIASRTFKQRRIRNGEIYRLGR